MLKTLRFKPPVAISRVSPKSGVPGSSVTLYGSGFDLFGANANANVYVIFTRLPDNVNISSEAVVADDGKSLTFTIPKQFDLAGCLNVPGHAPCSAVLINGVNINICPPRDGASFNLCHIAIPYGVYSIALRVGTVQSRPKSFNVTPSKSHGVSISLVYTDGYVSPGVTITVRGNGFAPSSNVVRIGMVSVTNLGSSDGKTITFRAPTLAEDDCTRFAVCRISVSNENGNSNSMEINYR